jgi:DNA adenine methylase
MRYLGGKHRIAKALAAEIDKVRKPGQLVWDAFCGGLSMSVALSKNGPVLASDACAPLIAMYLAVHSGWDPPTTATRAQRDAALDLPDTDPMKAFLRFGCGFAGNWSSGFAESDGRSYAAETRRGLLSMRTLPLHILHVDFMCVPPMPTDAALYLDPPYAGATPYAAVRPFDSAAFAKRVREWSAFADVFVSEYSLPYGACVWQKTQTTTVSRNKSAYAPAVERLYYIAKGSL